MGFQHLHTPSTAISLTHTHTHRRHESGREGESVREKKYTHDTIFIWQIKYQSWHFSPNDTFWCVSYFVYLPKANHNLWNAMLKWKMSDKFMCPQVQQNLVFLATFRLNFIHIFFSRLNSTTNNKPKCNNCFGWSHWASNPQRTCRTNSKWSSKLHSTYNAVGWVFTPIE